MRCPTNAMTLERFHEDLPPLDPEKGYWCYTKVEPGDWVTSSRDKHGLHRWKVIAKGAMYYDHVYALLEMPTRPSDKGGTYDKYWSYGLNEEGEYVIRRKMLVNNLTKVEEGESMCRCRTSYCYCDTTMTYEVNEHSLTVEVTKGKTIRLTLDECNELASFLATAKSKIKEAKLAALKEQQDELAKQLAEVESM